MKKSEVLVCESNFLIKEGIKSVINKNPFFETVQEAKSHDDLEAKLSNGSYDIVTIDFADEPHFGLDSISFIQEAAPKAKILVISNEDNKRTIYDVLSRGVENYVTKNCRDQEIYKALDACINSEKYYCGKILDIIIDKTFGDDMIDDKDKVSLTKRESEIVQLIAQGKMAKEISSILNISVHTIYTHRKNVMKKLDISSPVELITYAINKGIVAI